MIDFSQLIEPLLLITLGITVFYAMKLERALSRLRREGAALFSSVDGLDISARGATSALAGLSTYTTELAQQIADRIEVGKKLQDDLAYLSDRGELVADRLESLIKTSRTKSTEAIDKTKHSDNVR